jgi:hypothetical protein
LERPYRPACRSTPSGAASAASSQRCRNEGMLRLATHAPGTISTTRDEDSVHVTILFQNKALHGDAVASENVTPSRCMGRS